MIHKFLKIALCTMLLLTSILMHAQDEDPGTDMEDQYGDLDEDGLESPLVPIDSGLLYLALAGSAVALYYFNSKIVQKV